MRAICSVLILPMVFLAFKGTNSLRGVNLILPSIVQARGPATLFCLYDLEGASLYSVQWYRGRFEFFRFVPNESPPAKAFQIPGLSVDVSASNRHQVTLRNIPVHLSGEFSCEVTTDAPRFSTSCASNNLTVVDVRLTLSNRIYRYGDVVSANCSLTPQVSPTMLTFHWNIQPATEEFTTGRNFNSISLKLNTSIYESKFSLGTRVRLSCLVWLNNGYHVTSKSVLVEVEPRSRMGTSGAGGFSSVYRALVCLYFINWTQMLL